MKYLKFIILLLFGLLAVECFAQNTANLVPNPSFEDVTLNNGQPVLNTWQDNIGTPDYFSDRFMAPFDNRRPDSNFRGSEGAFDGVAIFGFAVLDLSKSNFREYMQTKLIDSLRKGEQYEIQFFISLADSFHLAVAAEDIGIYLANSLDTVDRFNHQLRNYDPVYYSDSIWNGSNKVGWGKFHYTYTAKGGENTIVIGCFKNNQEVTIDSVGEGGSFKWALQGSFYFIDQISVRWVDTTIGIKENVLKQQLQLYPNPVKDQFFLTYSGQENLDFVLYDLKGKEMSFSVSQMNVQYEFNLPNLPAGIYFLKVSDGIRQTTFKVLKQ